MKTERKSELKGALKAIIAIAILGMAIGIGYATTVITDENIWIDNNPVIVEGDYTTWTHKWTNTYDNGIYQSYRASTFIDTNNEVVIISWEDSSRNYRFGIYTLSDFSIVVESSPGGDYTQGYADQGLKYGFELGTSYPSMGGISRSIQSYILLTRLDASTIEVWRGSSSWSHNVSIEDPSSYLESAEISIDGKYILVTTSNDNLILYEGS